MASQKRYQDRGICLDESKIKPESQYCDICDAAKGHQVISHREVDKEMGELGLTWHIDMPAQHDTPGIVTGKKSRCLFTERKSRFRALISFRDNTEESVLSAVQLWFHKFIVPIKEEYERRSLEV
jgi:hypothetical protein